MHLGLLSSDMYRVLVETSIMYLDKPNPGDLYEGPLYILLNSILCLLLSLEHVRIVDQHIGICDSADNTQDLNISARFWRQVLPPP